MVVRPTARAMNKPLLIANVDRRLLGLAFMVSGVIAVCSPDQPELQALIGASVFVLTIVGAKRLTRKDDRVFQIALSVWRQKPVYDPLIRELKS